MYFYFIQNEIYCRFLNVHRYPLKSIVAITLAASLFKLPYLSKIVHYENIYTLPTNGCLRSTMFRTVVSVLYRLKYSMHFHFSCALFEAVRQKYKY